MPQDAFTLKYLCEELNNKFVGGKVNRIVQPDNDRVIFTVYTGKKTEKLLISVNPACPRIGVTFADEDSPLTAPNFCMLLRKHLLSSTISDVSLVGFDRIVKIDFSTSAEFCDSVVLSAYVELMGRYSNIILTQEGKVLGGNRGINNFDNGVRPLIVGHKYILPPSNGKKEPCDKELLQVFSGVDKENIAECVFTNVSGISKETAEEFASLLKKESTPQEIFDSLNAFVYNAKKQPCVITEKGIVKDMQVYPYAGATGEIKEFDTLCQTEDYFFTQKEKSKLFSQKKERYSGIINSAIKKVKKRLVNISSKEKAASDCEDNRLKGELITANIYRIKRGEKECVLQSYYDGADVQIALDERLSPAENAQAYYKKYNKQKRTLVAIKPQRESAEKELEYYLSVFDEIETARDGEDLKQIGEELEFSGLIQKTNSRKKKEEPKPYRVYSYKGYTVKVGRNNVENDRLTFGAKPMEMWLHVKDYHSAHCIIEDSGKPINEDVIKFAAEITAFYSKAREGGKAEVVFTYKKNVKKPPKANLGFVTYTDFKSVVVTPNAHEESIKTN